MLKREQQAQKPPTLLQGLETHARELASHLALETTHGDSITYENLLARVKRFADGLGKREFTRGDRVAAYIPKTLDFVVGFYGTMAAGGIFIPVNPALKPAQVGHILDDASVRLLITDSARASTLKDHAVLSDTIAVRDCAEIEAAATEVGEYQALVAGTAPAVILYTSGSTGLPKGVVVSHDNLSYGAASVTEYLNLSSMDRLLAVLPLSFDYGLNQLTSALSAGACCVLHDYLLAQDIPRLVAEKQITGLAAVPPLWFDLAKLAWPEAAKKNLRYLTNSGGHFSPALIDVLSGALPSTDIFSMYGLTESFRSSYLPPAKLKHKPNSIGQAVPYAELYVVNAEGNIAAPYEHGELVHRGPLVTLGYWQQAEATCERFQPAQTVDPEATADERVVYSGDTVYRDDDNDLFFVARNDEMIKTSGYRVSPHEIESVLVAHPHVSEAVALGLPDDRKGEAIFAFVACQTSDEVTVRDMRTHCAGQLASYLQPDEIFLSTALPRNVNGKIDRAKLREEACERLASSPTV